MLRNLPSILAQFKSILHLGSCFFSS